MSDQPDPKELIGKVEDADLRSQLEDVFGSLSGSTLRKQVEDLTDQVKQYRQKDRTRAFRDAGFDPDAGPGKALAKLYDGEADPDAIRQFASDEFGFEPNAGSQGEDVPDPAAERAAGEERVAQLGSGAIAPRDPSPQDRLRQAEANGDWATVDRINAELIEAQRRAG